MMPKPSTVREDWQSYERDVMPADAGATQRSETRMAFYAGAWAMLTNVKLCGEPDMSEEAGCVYLELVTSEIERFCRAVKEGREP